jgi:ribonuclease HI
MNKSTSEEGEYMLRFDGCSKGNPGLSGAGAVIYNKEGIEIWSAGEFVGEKGTNNIAEYQGLLLGFRNAILLGIISIKVEGDSLLVIKQMKGEYKVNSSHLYELYETAKNFEKQFQSVTYEHILRSFNKRADLLANKAVENYRNTKINVCINEDESSSLSVEEDLHEFISLPLMKKS